MISKDKTNVFDYQKNLTISVIPATQKQKSIFLVHTLQEYHIYLNLMMEHIISIMLTLLTKCVQTHYKKKNTQQYCRQLGM